MYFDNTAYSSQESNMYEKNDSAKIQTNKQWARIHVLNNLFVQKFHLYPIFYYKFHLFISYSIIVCFANGLFVILIQY